MLTVKELKNVLKKLLDNYQIYFFDAESYTDYISNKEKFNDVYSHLVYIKEEEIDNENVEPTFLINIGKIEVFDEE